MGRRAYTPQQKTQALALYETHGPTAVQKQLGIPKNTVMGWARKANVRTVRTERTRAAVEARIADGRARRQKIVEQHIELHALMQARLLNGEKGNGWRTLVRGAGGSEYEGELGFVPTRDARELLSALNANATIMARLDDTTRETEDGKSVIGDLIQSLRDARSQS